MDAEALSFILILFLMAAGTWLYGVPHLRQLHADWNAFRVWQREHSNHNADEQPAIQNTESAIVYDTRTLPGAATALARPPASLRAVHHHIINNSTGLTYRFPLGWRAANGAASLTDAAFVGDVNHIALTGFTDSGKDSWAYQALLYLALRHTPEQLQLAIVDGKGGLSWLGWEHKQHVALFAEEDHDIRPAMDWLRAERQRRRVVLKAAKCEKWEEYDGGALPLLVVFISELMLLQDATSKTELADWLNSELTSARAMGIRYIVSSQTLTRLDTRWRSQIGLYIAGYQPRADADEPNTGLTAKEIIACGTAADGSVLAVPPSALPIPPAGAGVFTCVQGRMARTVRATYMSKTERHLFLTQLPEKPPPAAADIAIRQIDDSTAIGHSEAMKAPVTVCSGSDNPSVSDVHGVALPVVAIDSVSMEEQRQIIEAAPSAASRRQLCRQLYGVDGGTAYSKIKLVLDAAGLL